MGVFLFSNLASGTLAGSITSSSTSLSLTSGQGALFPDPSGGNAFMGILITSGQSASPSSEIVMVTARSTDTLTIVRAQEGTTAAAWAAGTQFALVPTAGTYGNFAQPGTLQAQAGNYAADTGSANAYSVTLTPALSAHVTGMPIRWLAGHTNTGSSTFNDGVAAVTLLTSSGAPLWQGAIIAGGLYTCVWNGANFVLADPGPVVGQFTPGYGGFSTNPELEISYVMRDGVVTLGISAGLGVSNSTGFQLTGLPAVITPVLSVNVPCIGLEDNSVSIPGGMVNISSGGALTFYKDGAGTPWTSSGQKGMIAISITYPIAMPDL